MTFTPEHRAGWPGDISQLHARIFDGMSEEEGNVNFRIHFDIGADPRVYLELTPSALDAWITRIRGDYFNNLTRGEAFGRLVSEVYCKMDAEDFNWDNLENMGVPVQCCRQPFTPWPSAYWTPLIASGT